MRKMTLSEIQSHITAKSQSVDYAVHLFRGKTKDAGWSAKRIKPRNPDEIKALNYIARKSLRNAMNDGTVRYDQERRVLFLAKYSRS